MAGVNQGARRVDSKPRLRQVPVCGNGKPLGCIAGAILKHERETGTLTQKDFGFRAIGCSRLGTPRAGIGGRVGVSR
jgi:hypothetical protein